MKDLYYYIVAVLLTTGLLWLAWQRPNRKRLRWRMLATAGAVAGLLLLALPPNRSIRLNPTEAILLTPGYQPDSLRAIITRLGSKTQVFSYKKARVKAPQLPHLRALRMEYPRVKRLHILGYGLNPDELAELDSVELITHLNQPPAGVVAADWSEAVTQGETVNVTGQFNQVTGKTSWLYLLLAGKPQDSVKIARPGFTRFQLKFLPRQAGKQILTLQQQQDKKNIFIGQIPVIVAPKRPLQVLILQSSPGFEFKFLKNYLAAEANRVAVRTSTSKNIYQTDYINLPRLNLNRLTTAGLQRFDLVITDTGVLQQLKTSEQKALSQSISEDGLGLLVLPDDYPLTRKIQILSAFRFKNVRKPTTTPLAIRWPESQKPAPASPLPATIVPAPELKALAWQPQGLVAAAKRQGWGSIGISLLGETFGWYLAGKKATYTSYWTSLLSQLAKPTQSDHSWHTTVPPLHHVNQPLYLQLSDYAATGNGRFPKGLVSTAGADSTTVYLAQQAVLPFRYAGIYWPRQTGWHQVQKPGRPPHFFYVFPDTAWTSWKQNITLNQTHHYTGRQPKNIGKGPDYYTRQPVPGIYFFLLFLACAGFLWLEEKL